jgi:hypothetical protein
MLPVLLTRQAGGDTSLDDIIDTASLIEAREHQIVRDHRSSG